MRTVRSLLYGEGCSVGGVSLTDPSGQRPPWTETPQTETPPLDEDHPGQRPPLDRDYLERDPPPDRNRDPPVDRQDTCENITFANFVCGR